MIVGTAGHVDHGKTAIVRALTGVDTDRLPEEKARGISIDLGFAYKAASGGRVLGFVDVPGHTRFIHNMLAGAAGIDAVLLVVAADDGPMPQTREHLAIVELLGITRGIIALTKCDLVDDSRRLEAVREIEELTVGTPFEKTEVVAVSSVTREGIERLERRLIEEAAAGTRHRVGGLFRMAVDRRFVVPGAGTVVTGTVFAGHASAGDEVLISPLGLRGRVRGLRADSREVDQVSAGQRCAINLSGSEIAIDRIQRGDWIVDPALHQPSERFDATLRLLPGTLAPMRHWAAMHLHIGTAHASAHIALLDRESIEPGRDGLVQIVVERPLALLAGDRFVLRHASAQRTVAGGVVLDPWPPNRGRRRQVRLQVLNVLANRNTPESLVGLLECKPGWVVMSRFTRAANLTPEETKAAVSALTSMGTAIRSGDYLVSAAVWRELREAVVQTLDKHHADAPDTRGLEASRLNAALSRRYPADLITEATASLLRNGEVGQSGPHLRRQGHSARLPGSDEALWSRIRVPLEHSRFSPPRVRDLATAVNAAEDAVRDCLRRLVRIGHVIEVAHDHFFMRRAVVELAEIAHHTAVEHGGVLATNAFRDRIGAGRKVAIQILEFLDKNGVTLRLGDGRVVRKERLSTFAAALD